MKLMIDRCRWLRGEGMDASYLLRENDLKMCCIGFYAVATGISDKELLGRKNPSEVKSWHPSQKWLTEYPNSSDEELVDWDKLIKANDNVSLPEDQREVLIKEIFAKHSVQVEFIN